jgi:hypothetical protein
MNRFIDKTVTISMRNMGLEEDESTGLSFTLQGTALALLKIFISL